MHETTYRHGPMEHFITYNFAVTPSIQVRISSQYLMLKTYDSLLQACYNPLIVSLAVQKDLTLAEVMKPP